MDQRWHRNRNDTGRRYLPWFRQRIPGESRTYECQTQIGTTLFRSDDMIHGRELWISDGTETGTILVDDIYPGFGSASPANLADMNGTLRSERRSSDLMI